MKSAILGDNSHDWMEELGYQTLGDQRGYSKDFSKGCYIKIW